MSSLLIVDWTGGVLPTGRNEWFGPGSIGGGYEYRVASLRNVHAVGSVTAGKLWVQPDPAGCGFAISILDGTARALGYAYAPNPAAGSYSTPTDAATGLVVPTLTAKQQILIGVRRDLSSGTTALPEFNVLHVDATVPIGYV